MPKKPGADKSRKTPKPARAAAGREAAVRRPATAGAAPFPIVGIGASAGGLEAFTQLLQNLPGDTGMAFVLIQHLDPAHTSLLRESLAKSTEMPVIQAEDGTLVERDHVYVIPPKADITIADGRLTLVPRRKDARRQQHLPVDFFLRALAAERGSRAIGVVLSGTASDGTEGLRAIKAADGLTYAQDPRSAKFPGMPESAIEAGVVDQALALAELAAELVRLSRHPYLLARRVSPAGDDSSFKKIVTLLKSRVGVDFAEYKLPTLERRLARRMALRRVDDPQAYLAVLQAEPDEVQALYEDILIHVTSFFRDPDVFDALKDDILPEILRQKAEGAPLRVWVAGCSSGEEVYALGITLLELLDGSPRPIQIFGSDVSGRAIEKARAGIYPDSALRDVSDERRRRFFTKVDGGHRIIKPVRDLCVFVEHNLANDPPFSKLDLVSCRNVLIYFEPELQERVLSRLHYALNQPGYLLLGRTENISGSAALFSPVDRTHKIFARSAARSTLRFARGAPVRAGERPELDRQLADQPRRADDLSQRLDRLLLGRYAPPGVLINDKMEIVQFRGLTGAYLQPAPGAPQNNLVKMAREGLLATLRATIARAGKEKAPVRARGVEVQDGDRTRTCDVVVLPLPGLPDSRELYHVVLFEEPAAPAAKRTPAAAPSRPRTFDNPRLARLELELAATKDYLHALVDEQGRTNDDLGSANEELISGNEELQSMNEELETAKEELQSTNEELTTVNDELHSRNVELAQVNSDLVNVLGTVDIPIVILDLERRIRRYTPNARRILSVLPADVGRPIDDIKLHIDAPDLDRQIASVIETMVVKEVEVQGEGGHWYRMQIRPYRTTDNRIDGAILSLVDIDALKQHVSDAQGARAEAERANRAKDQFLATLSHELRSPLASMLMHAQLLRHGALDDAMLRRAGEAIERGTRMQLQLIEDLLDVSRIIAGKLRMERRAVDLADVIQAAIDGVRAQADRKSIKITVALGRPGRVFGDATRLQQVVNNLLANAIKFTPEGGQVTVTLDGTAGHARLMVRDTGAGIEPGFLPEAFNRFTQEDSSNTRTYGGLGLGLAIVRHLVELHGGTVRAESPGKGHGSTFVVTLPLMTAVASEPPPAPRPRPAAGPAPAGARELHDLRVLVVDDDPPTREAVAEMLQQSGAGVAVAGSADEAMAALQRAATDVLVCDIAMPGEDGLSLIRRLRALGPGRGGDTPALALTALAGDEDRRLALEAGFQLYLAKPVDMDRLIQAVAALGAPAAPSARGLEPR